MADMIIGFLGLMALCLMAVVGTVFFFVLAFFLVYIACVVLGTICIAIFGTAEDKMVSGGYRAE